MADRWIGIISLIVSVISLLITICIFIESKSTKHAVLSYKTRKEYELYKATIIPELETMISEIVARRTRPEYRPKLIEVIKQMEGYKEHLNKTTKTALIELESLLGTKRKPDVDITLSLFGISQKMTIPARSKVADQPLADVLSKLIGGLKQPAPKLFE